LPEEIEEIPEHKNAPPDTPLGMLQRGRGAGYLWALQQDPHTLHPLLVECITHDPRLDRQIEQRADYYARLALLSRMDLAPLADYLRTTPHDGQDWEVSLTIETLGRIAEMGNAEAALILSDYVAYGAQWDFALWQLADLPETVSASDMARAICERFKSGEEMDDAASGELLDPSWLGALWEKWTPRYPCIERLVEELNALKEERKRNRSPFPTPEKYTGMPTTVLLEAVGANNWRPVQKAALSKLRRQDKQLYIQAFEMDNPFAWWLAFECLSALRMAEPVYDTAQRKSVEYLPRLEPSGEPRGLQVQKRRVLEGILKALPPEMTLPYARRWFNSPDWHLEMVAHDLLEKHATIEDLPMVQAALAQRLEAGPDELETYGTSSLLEILSRFADIGPVPEVERTFIETGYSYGRMHAARAMRANAPEWFARGYALECMWDCQEETRIIGSESVALDLPGAVERLRALADDPFEDESVRDAARKRAPAP
jgi:hypothetical protein